MGQPVKQLKWAYCEKNKEALVLRGEKFRSEWLRRWQVREPMHPYLFPQERVGVRPQKRRKEIKTLVRDLFGS